MAARAHARFPSNPSQQFPQSPELKPREYTAFISPGAILWHKPLLLSAYLAVYPGA